MKRRISKRTKNNRNNKRGRRRNWARKLGR